MLQKLDIQPEPYEVVKPFSVVVRSSENDFVASFIDANLSASGDTLIEAVDNLKDIIIGTFKVLSKHNESKLGKIPIRQRQILQNFMREV